MAARSGASLRRKGPSVGTLGASQPKPSRRRRTPVQQQQQYVGIDLHRRRSVIVRMNDAGEVLDVSKIDNDPVALAMAVAEAGPDPEVALEAVTAGIGRPICSRRRGPGCIWSIRWVCTGTPAGSKTT